MGAGQYKRAVDSLWEAEVLARADLYEARELLQAATELRDRATGRIRAECDELIEDAEKYIGRETAIPLAIHADGAVAVIEGWGAWRSRPAPSGG